MRGRISLFRDNVVAQLVQWLMNLASRNMRDGMREAMEIGIQAQTDEIERRLLEREG